MSEADLVFNRANVALARSQRLIASWLPEGPDKLASDKSEEQLRQEEDEVFTPIPEKLGLGAPLPQKRPDGAANRSELDSNNRLRKHLLGSDRRKASDQTQTQTHHRTHSKGNASRRPPESASDPDFDFEESRSSLGKRKRKRALEETDTVARSKTHEANDAPDTNKGDRNRGNSYLDELLSKRSRKKAGKDKSL